MSPPKKKQEPITQLGFPKKVTAKFAEAAKGNRPAHFILPFSLLDLSHRDDKFLNATQAKIAAYLKLIETYFPQASIEFLFGDTLRLENDFTQSPQAAQQNLDTLLKQWEEFLDLPVTQLSAENPTLQAQYTTQYIFKGFEQASAPHALTLSSWRSVQGDKNTELSQLIQRVHDIFKDLLKPNPNTNILTHDDYLYAPHRLNFVKEHFAGAFSKILKHTLSEARIFKEDKLFKTFIEGFGLTAVHHLKKVHGIDIDTAEVDTPTQKKRNILSALPNEIAPTAFAEAYCYALTETLVIFNILAQQPDAKTRLTWMLYPSGIVDAPHYHPCLIVNEILGLASLPGRFYTGSGFMLPQPVVNHPSSYGGNNHMYHTTQPKPINPPPAPEEQAPNGSPSTSNGSAHRPVSPGQPVDSSDDEAEVTLLNNRSSSSSSSGDRSYDELESEAAQLLLQNPKNLALALSLLGKAKEYSAQEQQRARSTSNASTVPAHAATTATVTFAAPGSKTARLPSPEGKKHPSPQPPRNPPTGNM